MEEKKRKSQPYSERKFDKKNAQKYNNTYIKNNYDRLNFTMPKGYKDKIKNAAIDKGISAAEFVRQAIDNYINNN